MFFGLLILLVFGFSVIADTSVDPRRSATPGDEAIARAYKNSMIQTSEFAEALWDTTIASMATTDTLTVDFTAFVANFKPVVIAMTASTADITVEYHGTAINALTGGDSVVSDLEVGISQNWRITNSVLTSMRFYPTTSTSELHVYIRGVIDD